MTEILTTVATMKKLEILIKPGKLDAVKKAMAASGYTGVTISQAEGHGNQKGKTQAGQNGGFQLELHPKVRLEVVISDADLEPLISAISKVAQTGQPGDGKIFVSDIRDVIRIRTGLSRDRVFRDLLARLTLPNPAQAFQAVLEREKAGSTLIGSQMAVPHARQIGVKGLQAALGISPDGPVRVWLLFISPSDDARIHLTFLAGISAFFQSQTHLEALLNKQSPKEILDYIRGNEIL